jgi:hypothetical protein
VCFGGACGKTNGTSCTTDAECRSNVCECGDASCDTGQKRCAAAVTCQFVGVTGAPVGNITRGTDPGTDCTGGQLCDGAGACATPRPTCADDDDCAAVGSDCRCTDSGCLSTKRCGVGTCTCKWVDVFGECTGTGNLTYDTDPLGDCAPSGTCKDGACG